MFVEYLNIKKKSVSSVGDIEVYSYSRKLFFFLSLRVQLDL